MVNPIIKQLLRESLNQEVLLQEIIDELDLSSFKMREGLNSKIWGQDGHIKEDIRQTLLKVANDYYESLELGIPLSDITLTGSLANYNWSRFSDADVHILFDSTKLGEQHETIKDLLDVKTRNWNDKHGISVKGFEVELYLQELEQAHHSTGVYSLINNEWVVIPKKKEVKLDKENISKKYDNILKTIADIKQELEGDGEYGETKDRVDKLKEKIRDMRKSGLETGGEFSVENIVFKLLRRNDIIGDINDLLLKAYDDSLTIEGDE
jgi:hypothetical protein